METALPELKTVLGIAHDLVCSVLLFVIVVFLIRAHGENVRRLKLLERLLKRFQSKELLIRR